MYAQQSKLQAPLCHLPCATNQQLRNLSTMSRGGGGGSALLTPAAEWVCSAAPADCAAQQAHSCYSRMPALGAAAGPHPIPPCPHTQRDNLTVVAVSAHAQHESVTHTHKAWAAGMRSPTAGCRQHAHSHTHTQVSACLSLSRLLL